MYLASPPSELPDVTKRAGVLCSGTVSLSGLLAYNDEDDREEPSFELNLFAEGFNELLSRDFGERILQALYAERCVTQSTE